MNHKLIEWFIIVHTPCWIYWLNDWLLYTNPDNTLYTLIECLFIEHKAWQYVGYIDWMLVYCTQALAKCWIYWLNDCLLYTSPGNMLDILIESMLMLIVLLLFSPDKMLHGRLFSYTDTQRYVDSTEVACRVQKCINSTECKGLFFVC